MATIHGACASAGRNSLQMDGRRGGHYLDGRLRGLGYMQWPRSPKPGCRYSRRTYRAARCVSGPLDNECWYSSRHGRRRHSSGGLSARFTALVLGWPWSIHGYGGEGWLLSIDQGRRVGSRDPQRTFHRDSTPRCESVISCCRTGVGRSVRSAAQFLDFTRANSR